MLTCIILAAGESSRFGGKIKKQFYKIGKNSLLGMSLSLTRNKYISNVILVLAKEDIKFFNIKYEHQINLKIVEGGATRNQSIYNALASIKIAETKIVLIEANRPNLTSLFFSRLCKIYIDSKNDIQFLTSSIKESLIILKDDTYNNVDRNLYFTTSTPYFFSKKEVNTEKLKNLPENLDILSMFSKRKKLTKNIIDSYENNVKVTYKRDMLSVIIKK